MFVQINQPISFPQRRHTKSLQNSRLRHTELKRQRKLDSPIFDRLTPAIEFRIVGKPLPLKAANVSSIDLAALQPQHPIARCVCPMQAEPMKSITCITFGPGCSPKYFLSLR